MKKQYKYTKLIKKLCDMHYDITNESNYKYIRSIAIAIEEVSKEDVLEACKLYVNDHVSKHIFYFKGIVLSKHKETQEMESRDWGDQI